MHAEPRSCMYFTSGRALKPWIWNHFDWSNFLWEAAAFVSGPKMIWDGGNVVKWSISSPMGSGFYSAGSGGIETSSLNDEYFQTSSFRYNKNKQRGMEIKCHTHALCSFPLEIGLIEQGKEKLGFTLHQILVIFAQENSTEQCREKQAFIKHFVMWYYSPCWYNLYLPFTVNLSYNSLWSTFKLHLTWIISGWVYFCCSWMEFYPEFILHMLSLG